MEILYLLDTEKGSGSQENPPQRLRPLSPPPKNTIPKTKYIFEDDPHGGAFPVPLVLYGWEAVSLSGGRPHRESRKKPMQKETRQ